MVRSPQGHHTVKNSNFLVFSLGINDVGRYGVDVSLERSSEIIAFIRRSFPGIQAIGWMALSPRWKPTKFVSAAEIGDLHRQFNERLQVLSKQLDFDVVDARLGPFDMRVEDGLHPSVTTGRWKYEEALRNWFSTHAVAHSYVSFKCHRLPSTLNDSNNNNNNDNNNNNNDNNNDNNNNNPVYICHHYRRSYLQQYSNRQVITDNNVASHKDKNDSLMIDIEEISVARPFTEKYTDFLNLTVNESDSDGSQISKHSDISIRELDISYIELDISNSNNDKAEENKKKRKLRETSILPSARKRNNKAEMTVRKKIKTIHEKKRVLNEEASQQQLVTVFPKCFRKSERFDRPEFLLWLESNQHLRSIKSGAMHIFELLDKVRIENPALNEIFLAFAENGEKVNPHSFDIARLVRPNDSLIFPPNWKNRTDSGATYV